MSFFPEEIQTESVSKYTKLPIGTVTLRMLGKPIFGWETWITDSAGHREPRRFELGEKINDADIGPDGIKQFMAVKVYNYNLRTIQVWQVTQKSVLKALKAYSDNKKYGDPTNYDIEIKREGEGKMTKYTITANPPEALSAEVKKADDESKCDLEAMFINGDPFGFKK